MKCLVCKKIATGFEESIYAPKKKKALLTACQTFILILKLTYSFKVSGNAWLIEMYVLFHSIHTYILLVCLLSKHGAASCILAVCHLGSLNHNARMVPLYHVRTQKPILCFSINVNTKIINLEKKKNRMTFNLDLGPLIDLF